MFYLYLLLFINVIFLSDNILAYFIIATSCGFLFFIAVAIYTRNDKALQNKENDIAQNNENKNSSGHEDVNNEGEDIEDANYEELDSEKM